MNKTALEAAPDLVYANLREANVARQAAWCPEQIPDLSFRGNELAGETGEVCNVVKKLERERLGWRGSRDTVAHLAEELADVVICADLVALSAGIDLDAAVEAKFNATSEKVGLPHRLRRSPVPAPAETEEDRALANFDKIADSFFASSDAMLSAPAEGVTDDAAEPFDTWDADALAVEIERLKKVSVTTNGIIAKMERRRTLLLAAPPCGLERPNAHTCPNMKEVGGGMDGERYRCAVCQKGYFLDYDEMR